MAKSGNGKVTLAIIGEKLDTTAKMVEELRKDVGAIKTDVAAMKQHRDDTDRRIGHLETRSNTWDFINTLAAGAAILFGVVRK